MDDLSPSERKKNSKLSNVDSKDLFELDKRFELDKYEMESTLRNLVNIKINF